MFEQYRKMGIVLKDRRRILNFPSSTESVPEGYLLHYSTIQVKPQNEVIFSIGRARGPWNKLVKEEAVLQEKSARHSSRFTIGNLPGEWQPTQPIHLELGNGRDRIYFWAHGGGVVRYLAAESTDHLNYNVINLHTPCLYHYNDRATELKQPDLQGLVWNHQPESRPAGEPVGPAEKCCNDATTVYRLGKNRWELYTAAISPARKGTGEVVPYDNAAGYRRHIRRYESRDGLDWHNAGEVILPDAEDPPYRQFYYLAVHHLKNGDRLGFLGQYNVEAQTMEVERCFSRDGIHWQRNAREPWIKRNLGDLGIYSGCNPLIPGPDGKMRFFYTTVNFTHNFSYCTGPRFKQVVQVAEIAD